MEILVISHLKDEYFNFGIVYSAVMVQHNRVSVTNDLNEQVLVDLGDNDFTIIINPDETIKSFLHTKYTFSN